MIEKALRELLLNDDAITAVVGDRVYPMDLPQNPVLPAITYEVSSGNSTYNQRGDSGLDRPRFQVDACAGEYGQSVELGDLIRTRLSGFRGQSAGVFIPGIFLEDWRDIKEEIPGVLTLNRRSQDFYVWNKR